MKKRIITSILSGLILAIVSIIAKIVIKAENRGFYALIACLLVILFFSISVWLRLRKAEIINLLGNRGNRVFAILLSFCVLMTCFSFAGSVITVKSYFWPKSDFTLTITGANGAPLRGIQVSFYQPEKHGSISLGAVTNDIGEITFRNLSFGHLKIYLWTRISDSILEFMEASTDIYDSKSSAHWHFNPRQVKLNAIPEIHFNYGEYAPRLEDRIALESNFSIFAKNPGRILIIGNCDEQGGDDANDRLGGYRANAVAEILAAHGIPRDRFRIISFGKRNPSVPGASGADEYRNRIVELVIIPFAVDESN